MGINTGLKEGTKITYEDFAICYRWNISPNAKIITLKDNGKILVLYKEEKILQVAQYNILLSCLWLYPYWVTQKLPQIYTANHATFPIQIRKITVQICGNFWVTQYKGQDLVQQNIKCRGIYKNFYLAEINFARWRIPVVQGFAC